MPYNDNGYLNPIHIVWRKGTSEDPYIDKAEYLKAVNQTMVLSEIPDEVFRVRIDELEEVNIDKVTHYTIAENQFAVNYATGVIQLHKSKEAESFNVFYRGRGFIQYPSNRIYHQDKFNDVIESLDEIVQRSLDSVKNLDSTIAEKVTDYQEIRDEIVAKISEMIIATDNANESKDNADIATDKALNAYETTRLVFLPYVEKFSDISKTYLNPQVGWTVQVYETGIRYRYDGIAWIPIDLFGGNIQIATETIDGLMSKDTYKKLLKVESDLGVLDEVPRERIIVFCFPYLRDGVNSTVARFPFKGEIISVKGICSKYSSETMTEIDIEKSTDMINWMSILDESYLTFEKEEYFDNGEHRMLARQVAVDEMFRINVRTLSSTIEGVTIEIKINININ